MTPRPSRAPVPAAAALALAFACAATAVCSGCCAPDLAGVPVRIDVHAHTFNSTDLPVRGFAERVAHLQPPIAALVARFARRGSVSAQQEAIRLRDLLRERREWDEQRDGARFVVLSQGRNLVPSTPDVHPDALVDELTRDPQATAAVAVALGCGEDAGLTASSTVVPPVQAERIAATLRDFAPVLFGWLHLLKRSRLDLAERLGRTYPDIDLFTPALVDFGAWLDDADHVPVAAQLVLGEWITRVLRGRVHFFAPFDPLAAHRSAASGNDGYFLTVADAVMQRGFLGFKLYPAMGFYPVANETRQPALPELSQEEWRGVDRQLERLYDFCADNKIPLLVHAGPALAAGSGFAERGAPAEWHPVLLARRSGAILHVNFAHFGWPNRAWTDDIGLLMNRFDGVFADAGDPGDPGTLALAPGRAEFVARMNAVTGSGKAPERVLYGGDQVMRKRELRDRCSLRDVARLFDAGGLRHVDRARFFGGNAVRYLRLGHGAAVRDRLERFYLRHRIPAGTVRWLRKAAPMAPAPATR